MKNKTDLVRGWLRKAESDRAAIEASMNANVFDVACFHAQQEAEKMLKAYLAYHELDFPPTHNLARLVRLCAKVYPAFAELLSVVEPLTPYAVALRYDLEFWPSRDDAARARTLLDTIREFVLAQLPANVRKNADI